MFGPFILRVPVIYQGVKFRQFNSHVVSASRGTCILTKYVNLY